MIQIHRCKYRYIGRCPFKLKKTYFYQHQYTLNPMAFSSNKTRIWVCFIFCRTVMNFFPYTSFLSFWWHVGKEGGESLCQADHLYLNTTASRLALIFSISSAFMCPKLISIWFLSPMVYWGWSPAHPHGPINHQNLCLSPLLQVMLFLPLNTSLSRI